LNLYHYLPANAIQDNKITRMAYARDASMYRLVPDAVVRPGSSQDVKALLGYARQTKTPITFRAGGTSLSGQSITSGIIAEALHDWSRFQVLDRGDAIRMQPGVNGAFANKLLLPYLRKIGPDPASINAARIGGIVSNNSSGMVCGTEFNAYHTLRDISFILANGHEYNTAANNENSRFLENEPGLAEGLLRIREKILDQPQLVKKIRQKYRIKNTIGYSMNSFLDHEDPLAIFSHLLVGAEGTLAFISEVTLKTIPDPPEKGTGLILFQSPETAGDSVPFFKDLGAAAIEFLDDQSLRTAKHFDHPPYDPNQISDDMTGLLIEFQEYTPDEIARLMTEVEQFVRADAMVHEMQLVTEEKDRDTIWKIRKGLYPTLGALRRTGTSVITEDIAVDMKNLAAAIRGLKKIFKNRDFHDGVIFGHAKDGNLHFITSIDLDSPSGERNYEEMMNDLSKMTVGQFNGSLKAEHGTGRNMAAFVETEWGGAIFELMWQVKKLADPHHILNPDVLLTRDQKLHMKDLKPLPRVHDEVDMCIECGFCERICPSAGLTLTPRQRIAVMREMKLNNLTEDEIKDFHYLWEQSCAADGLCAEECPVNIDTGRMVKDARFPKDTDPGIVQAISNHFRFTVGMVNRFIGLANTLERILGNSALHYISGKCNRFSNRSIPTWPESGIARVNPLKFPAQEKSRPADFIHFPACVNRIFPGNPRGESSSSILHKIGQHAGKRLSVLDQYEDQCCGMVFDSRGYRKTGNELRKKLLKNIAMQSDRGRVPVIIDLSPCTQYILAGDTTNLQILDSITFMNQVKADLKLSPIPAAVFTHPVCSSQKMGNGHHLIELAQACAGSVETSMEGFCCGMAGDRGLRVPELPRHAVETSTNPSAELGVSSSRTCEMGLKEYTGLEFISMEELVMRAIANST